MGRRALRKTDPSLDLSQHFHTLDDLSSPLDVARLFPQKAPLEIEVGCGKGMFMATASAAVCDHNFLGIEVSEKYARFSAARLAKTRRDNAVMIHGDGLRLFREMLPDSLAMAVHVYFPDPWWKKRHRKRRVMNQQFLRDVERVLVIDGRLHFWTDVEEYFQTSLEVIRESTTLEGPINVKENDPQHDMDYRTHFERRMRLHKEQVYRAEFVKAGNS